MSLYMCDGCREPIPAQKARVHCQMCPGSYDLCANCFVVGVATQNHASNHGMITFRTSNFTQAPHPPALPQHPPVQQSPQAQPSASPQGYAPQQRAGWQPLFNGTTWTPNHDYVSLAQNIFAHLDPSHTGYLTPEAYSSLLDLLGVTGPRNVWRFAYQSAFGSNREGQADHALKQVYDMFHIEYVLHPRQSSQGQSQSSLSNLVGLVGGALPTSQMPLLTLRGFIDLATLDALSNPSKAVGDLNRVMQTYQLPIWREKGDLPRWALPDAPVPHVVNKLNAAAPAPSPGIAQQGMNANLMAQLHSADQSRFSANQIGQDSTYEYVRRDYYY
ncbi:hypothetical protein GQ53DRAFT_869566 [Thozetella sp. PMI_491]|nr:hypothetical protein GQ53DRAFT_869566 [Thozetella sp. PMI_491]